MEINTVEVSTKSVLATETVSLLEKTLRGIGILDAQAFSTQLFSFSGNLSEQDVFNLPSILHHDVTQDATVNKPLDTTGREWDFAIRVDYKPGVTDNSARVVRKDLSLIDVPDVPVYTSNIHYISGEFDLKLEDMLERVASNPQIHDITILQRDEFVDKGGFENTIHPVLLGDKPDYFNIDLAEMSDDDLLKMGKLGTLNTDFVKPDMKEEDIDKLRGGELALDEDYLIKIKEYAMSELNTSAGRAPGVLTDVEMEVLGQMWSEHCRHSLYNASIPESDDGIFTHYIKKPTERVLEDKPELGLSIYKDNAGVFKFNDLWSIVIKNETHNSPSALDPFGGSITGIVGVNRDPMGTGQGADLLFNFLFYFLGHPEDTRRYFKTKKFVDVADDTFVVESEFVLENLLLNPGQIKDGVVDGVEKGANQMGVPLQLGTATYHDNYNGKPIVGVGTCGRMPKKIGDMLSHEKHIDLDDRLYILGGRAGRDGIHGATFSSKGLTESSPATAVQIGDPYTQRKLSEALIELRDKGYINFVTDLGAGGVSCAALEMAEETGGLDIDIDKLLIKYPGMTASELFLNESQERMAIAINPKFTKEVEEILKEHEVEFSDIGHFTDSGRAIVKSKGERVVDMDMDFIHKGFPSRSLAPKDYKLTETKQRELSKQLSASIEEETNDKSVEFYDMFTRPNLSSHAHFLDRMDSTVKGLGVQHCIQGKGRVSTLASCSRVDHESFEGLIHTYGHSERQVYIDAEKMGKNAFLRSIGNNVAMGGKLDHMVSTDQALWQSSKDGRYQQMLIEANRGMANVIEGCKIPVISGKDSMFNQASVFDENGDIVQRGVYPTILMSTIAKIDDVDDIVTVDAKESGDLVYVVGSTTRADMGGSEYHNMIAERDGVEYAVGKVSDTDMEDVFHTFETMNVANKAGVMQSANYVEAGGLVTALKETAMAGEKGIAVDLDAVHQESDLRSYELMYGETEGRFVVTVSPEKIDTFEKLFEGKYSKIGIVTSSKGFMALSHNDETIVNESVDRLVEQYHEMDRAA